MVVVIISGGGSLKEVLPLAELEAGRTISHARTPRTIYGCEINSPVLSASFPGVSSRSGIHGGSWMSSFSRLEHARVVLGLGH